MKTHNRRRTQGLGLISALIAILAGIPEAQAQGAQRPQEDVRAVAPLPPRAQWHGLASELRAQVETKRNVLAVLSALTGQRALRRIVESLSSTPILPAVTESLAQERAWRRGTLVESDERPGIMSVITSPAVQIAYASSGAGLFAAGFVVSKVIPASRQLAVYPQPWPAGIQISGSFH